MLSGRGTPTLPEQVEQALAFGRSYAWIRSHLGASLEDIAAAKARMAAACSDDEPFVLGGVT